MFQCFCLPCKFTGSCLTMHFCLYHMYNSLILRNLTASKYNYFTSFRASMGFYHTKVNKPVWAFKSASLYHWLLTPALAFREKHTHIPFLQCKEKPQYWSCNSVSLKSLTVALKNHSAGCDNIYFHRKKIRINLIWMPWICEINPSQSHQHPTR